MSIHVSDWLRRLGLEQYAPSFAANDIDGDVLSELTADDLIGLGVTSIGHRRKILAAIAALRATTPGGASPLPNSPPLAGEGRVGAEAKRRQLTVMFCDLVGSTALSRRFDPEDLREIVSAYHRCVADTVARFSGFVAKYMGDGVLIYFGYPEAHEDDAERAVRAGLAVIDAVGGLPISEPLNVRLGAASGLVVVGDLIGAGAAQERGVVGETPNLAARLQALAQPGTLVVTDSTRRQIGAFFDTEDLGPLQLAGFCRAAACLARDRRKRRCQPLRGAALGGGAARRARRRVGLGAPLLAAVEIRQRASGARLGRAGDRQIAAHRGARRPHRERAPHAAALFLLALSSGQRALSVHHSARTGRRLHARRHGRREA
jgi:class 3 adenylate cyclase